MLMAVIKAPFTPVKQIKKGILLLINIASDGLTTGLNGPYTGEFREDEG